MSHATPSIAYASEGAEPPADRFLRRVVVWSAMVYGGLGLIGSALHIALAKGWVASPDNMSWALEGGWHAVPRVASALTNSALVLGGILLLRRVPAAIVLLRVAVAATIVLSAVAVAGAMHAMPTYASYWSTPASASVYAMNWLSGLWAPVLIGLLTLPPLARRMV